jgi:anti-anti-sigma regulatory factor
MANLPANLLVAVGESLVCFKLVGRANFTTSVDFKKVAEALRLRGHTRFLLDLTGCLAMDSTFLGVLSGLAQRLADTPGGAEKITLVNAGPRITDFLDNLGVLHWFQLVTQDGSVNGTYEAVAASAATKAELSRVSLEAHQTLMDLNPANIPRFKDVARFLAEDLKQNEK